MPAAPNVAIGTDGRPRAGRVRPEGRAVGRFRTAEFGALGNPSKRRADGGKVLDQRLLSAKNLRGSRLFPAGRLGRHIGSELLKLR